VTLEIVPFADEHLDGAAQLLAERHARHREVEPLLPEVRDFRAEIEREWRADGTSGAVALAGGEAVGYLIGWPREDPVGPHVWSHVAGHAVREPELTRDLYAAAATRWVEEGLTRHYVFVPALAEFVDPWFRLSFGASAVLAMRETEPRVPVEAGVVIRDGRPDDLDDTIRLDREMTESMRPAPSFSGWKLETDEELRDEWSDTWDNDTFRHFVAERDGRVVGHALLYRRPADLRMPADAIDLANAATEPASRGTGVGLALTAHVFDWAHRNGHSAMVTDWRMTNLLASRFWPRRGFRETFLRLYRSIP
jgi:GNAT superfamily N-acetyltransferase